MTVLPNPIIAQLCNRLRSNDPELTKLSFHTLPIFEIKADDCRHIFHALLANHVVTHLDCSLPDPEDEDGDSCTTEIKYLFQQVLVHPKCSIKVLTVARGAAKYWSFLCKSLSQNISVRVLEFGTAACFLDTNDTEQLDDRACRQLARALETSQVEQVSLRQWRIDKEGLPPLVQGLKTMKQVELQQIISNVNLFHYLPDLGETLEKLSVIECKSTTINPGAAVLDGETTCTKMSNLGELCIAQCNANEFCHVLCALARGRKLHVLDLHDTLDMERGDVQRLAQWLQTQCNLHTLVLEGCNLHDADLPLLLQSLESHDGIRHINVRRNNIQGMFTGAYRLPRCLESFDISENKNVGRSSWLRFLMKDNPQVQEWNLNAINLIDDDLRLFFRAIEMQEGPCSIRVLHLRQAHIELGGMVDLSKLLKSKLANLKDINLASSQLDDDMIAILAGALTHHPSLVKLTVAFNPLGNEACRILAEMAKQIPNLRSLEFSFGKFDHDGIRHFIQTLQANPVLDSLSYWMYDSFGTGETDLAGRELTFWLNLNKSGRRVTREEVPRQLYPLVLKRAGNTNALYFILRESAQSFLQDKP